MDGRRARHVQAVPARIAQAPGEVDLVRVDEEVGVEVVDLGSRLAPHEQSRGLAPVDLARAISLALYGVQAVHEQRARKRGEWRGEAPSARLGAACARAARAHTV